VVKKQRFLEQLHLFLRITDVLYDLLITDNRELDGKQANQTDLSAQPHLRIFFSSLSENYTIRVPFYVLVYMLSVRQTVSIKIDVMLDNKLEFLFNLFNVFVQFSSFFLLFIVSIYIFSAELTLFNDNFKKV
jgi:hypothetical protein